MEATSGQGTNERKLSAKQQKKQAKRAQKEKHGSSGKKALKFPPLLRKQALFFILLEKTMEDQRLLHVAKGGKLSEFVFDRTPTGIPWWRTLFHKGTTVVGLKLNFTSTKISTAAATAYSTVFLINFGACTNHTPLAAVFDEYRLFKGKITYHPFGVPNLAPAGATDTFMGAVIDYDDSSVLTNFGDAFDTVQYGQCVTGPAWPRTRTWPVLFDWLPDMTWTTTTVTATPVAYWKPFIGSAHGLGALAIGYVTGHLEIQFRQLI